MSFTLEHVATGGNRYSSAADWAPLLLAFGAGNNIALWNPENNRQAGITALLAGHTAAVNAVKILVNNQRRMIISGSADKTIRIWSSANEIASDFQETQCLTEHANSINALAILPEASILISGSADATVKVWQLQNATAKLVQSISLKPRYLPLALAITSLSDGSVVIAIAGTSNIIYLYVRAESRDSFELQASLSGHEGWIRSLAFTNEFQSPDSDVLLASASQDKYIRLWRFRKGQNAVKADSNLAAEFSSTAEKKSLSNKAHQVGSSQSKHNVTFEALLIGHEDWIYTVCWEPASNSNTAPALLSASADNSLAIWHADLASGLWVCDSRLGEIGAQKGSTTATGSTGGFWIGLWHPQGHSVASLSRTGSWRQWSLDSASNIWLQQVGISGHTQEVQSIAWSPHGGYLLSTSSDQTTRILGEWRRNGLSSWHELSRPQIHGYDLNCIDTITDSRFISGADEKLLRVFNEPKAVDVLLANLNGVGRTISGDLPDVANIPVLGLSNKAITEVVNDEQANGLPNDHDHENEILDSTAPNLKVTLDFNHPPFEDHLARHTLWPEHEKLYGHGYEISTVATSNDGTLVATACKASSIDHAVIRLYETTEWREVKPALSAHSLTVTSLAFSPDDNFLLSVGRDRQWTLFKRREKERNSYKPHISNPKGHSRMILDCSWAPVSVGHVFTTAGRDKTVKIWRIKNPGVDCIITISAGTSVTAVAMAPFLQSGSVSLAYGTEEGKIALVSLDGETLVATEQQDLDRRITPSKTVNSLRWRPREPKAVENGFGRPVQLAAASDDSSVRIYSLS